MALVLNSQPVRRQGLVLGTVSRAVLMRRPPTPIHPQRLSCHVTPASNDRSARRSFQGCPHPSRGALKTIADRRPYGGRRTCAASCGASITLTTAKGTRSIPSNGAVRDVLRSSASAAQAAARRPPSTSFGSSRTPCGHGTGARELRRQWREDPERPVDERVAQDEQRELPVRPRREASRNRRGEGPPAQGTREGPHVESRPACGA